MLRFFRLLRKKLLEDLKLFKYLLYALGEIVLVIIGILIAVNINNANEGRKQERKIRGTLAQTENEVRDAINNGAIALRFCLRTDSLARVVLTKNPTFQDYKSSRDMALLLQRRGAFTIENDSYQNLVELSAGMPEKYEKVLDRLNNLYMGHWPFVEKGLEKFNNKMERQLAKLLDTEKWAGDFMQQKVTDDAIEYMLNDFRYKNMVSGKLNSVGSDISLYTLNFRLIALECHEEIERLLGPSNESFPSSSPVRINPEEYSEWVGKYALGDLVLEIEASDSSLHLTNNFQESEKPEKFYPIGKNAFHTETFLGRILLTGDSTKRGLYVPNGLEEFFFQKRYD